MKRICALPMLLLLLPLSAYSDTDINVVGLFNNKAIVIINKGKPLTLTAGQPAVQGVRLLQADSQKAVLEVEGKRKELGMGQAATVVGNAASAIPSVTLYADARGHHFSEGQINGATFRILIDTGASAILMNSMDAKKAGIDYKKGETVQLNTANGIANGYLVTINTLRLQGLVLNQVEGVVMEGTSPQVVLLGMTALNRLEMKREGIALTLTKKY
jgi:aspartyl protease family protein